MRAILLVNRASGGGKTEHIIETSKKRFEKEGYHLDVYFSTRALDLEDKALLWAQDYDLYLVCGGDGTFHEVVNGVMKSTVRPHIAVIPAGTVNDIAKILGIPKNIDKNLDLIFNSDPVEMDINQINDNYFTYVAGAGYLTEVSYQAKQEEKRKYGQLAYLKTGIKGLRKKPYFKAQIKCNGVTVEDEMSLIIMLSANQFGGLRLWQFSKKTKLNDGLVDIRIFKGRNLILLARLVLFILLAGRKKYKEIHFSTNHAIITPLDDKPLNWNADGEKVTVGKVEVKVIPRAISVYVSDKQKKKLF